MKPLFCCLFSCILLNHGLSGQRVANPPQALWPGELISEELRKSLAEIGITAADKGKAILIDFFEIGCSACLELIPHLNRMQELYEDRLQIIGVTSHQDSAQVWARLAKIPLSSPVLFPVLVKDSVLRQFFPHRLISHLVWIDPEGRVAAITGSKALREDHLEALFAGRLRLPEKRDRMEFEYALPLLQSHSDPPPAFQFYSALTAGLPGVDATHRRTLDTADGTINVNYFNYSFAQLLRIVYPKKIITPKLALDPGGLLQADTPLYCYSLRMPLIADPAAERAFISMDLRRWIATLGIGLRTDSIPWPCLALKKMDRPSASSPFSASQESEDLGMLQLAKTGEEPASFHLSTIDRFLNGRFPQLPWVVNEAGLISRSADDLQLTFPSSADLPSVLQVLEAHGYSLQPVIRKRWILILEKRDKEDPNP